MKKILIATLLLLSTAITAQNYLTFGGSIVAPKTDTGNETGASLSASFGHIVRPITIQPTIALSMMSGIDNPRRRERQYSYNVETVSVGVNISTVKKLYGIVGLHYNGNLVSSEFKLTPNQFDKVSKHNLFFSEYVGFGYRTVVNLEFGLMHTNTNYLEGYYPITSKHNDMFLQFKISYDILLKKKCKCLRNVD